MEKFVSFLSKSKSYVTDNDNTKSVLHIVMGNEASDADSMVTSILHAYFCSELRDRDSSPSPCYVPVINIPKADFGLRTEARWLFEDVGIPLDKLVFLDDINLSALAASTRLKLTLTDHNKISTDQAYLDPFIVEIIDHHDDEKLYLDQLKHKVIEPVGSCCTLIGEEILNYAEKNKTDAKFVDESLAKLLIAVILLDTNNFNPKAGRTTAKDTNIFEALTKFCKDIDFNDFFKKLQFEKFNISFLSSFDLLRKDYKDWIIKMNGNAEHKTKLGMSSITQSIKTWEEKETNLQNELLDYFNKKQLDLLLVMTAFVEPNTKLFSRQLMIFTTLEHKQLFNDLIEFLTIQKKIELELTDFPLKNNQSSNTLLSSYSQANTAVSRKILYPILKKQFFEKK